MIKSDNKAYFSQEEVCERLNISLKTLDYWRIQLLINIYKDEFGICYYLEDDVSLIDFALQARSNNISVHDIVWFAPLMEAQIKGDRVIFIGQFYPL